MYRVASRLPKKTLLAAATGAVLVDRKDKLSIYSEPSPEILLVETTSPLEQQIGGVRRQVTGAYQEAQAYVQGWVGKWISVEQAVEHRVKSIISPNESLTPGLLYVGVATLTGSIISRNRFILTRLVLPPAFLVASAHHFLPQTTHNLSEYLSSLEEAYLPTVAEKHEIAKAHSAMAWERLKEATAEARAKANSTALKSVEQIQGATGLKIKETLGLGQPAARKWERKVIESARVAGDEVERVVKAPYVTDGETAKFGQEVREKIAGAFRDAEKEAERAVKAPYVNDGESAKLGQQVREKIAGVVQDAEKEAERVKAPYVNDVEAARLGQQVRDRIAGVVQDAEKEVKRVVDAPYVADEETRRLGEQARGKVAETVRDAEKEVEGVVDAPYTTPEEQKKVEDLKDKDLPKLV